MNQEETSDAGEPLGAFQCNICGARNVSTARSSQGEQASCSVCRSSIRFRSIVLTLSRALFGLDLALPQFPALKSLRGLGIGDSEIYSGRLAGHFSYTNTFLDRDPRFDLLRPDEKQFGVYDFVICADVLEHVPAPVEQAFINLARLLKPAGVLILTVPYSLEQGVHEHFPELAESAFVEFDGRTVLVGRCASGEYRVFDGLIFHGGSGSTLERRMFSEESIRLGLRAAGFSMVRFDCAGSRQFGVRFAPQCTLPILARREPFSLHASGVTELVDQISKAHALQKALRSSRWLRLGRAFGLGPDLGP